MGHTGAYIINSFFTGSSPPMLGIPLSAPGGDLSKWFIPTYVGHTTPWRSFCPARPVHPHLRGAYPYKKSADFTAYGSSPHTWGIPAVRAFMAPAFPVHPHIRGAYGHRCRDGAHAQRFIPTYVGHTAGRSDTCGGCTVHPHIRGAYGFLLLIFLGGGGSSPHTWGIPQSRRLQPAPARFIPTYVGHTKSPAVLAHSKAVHPHIRGAYSYSPLCSTSAPGSSPHTWGIHWTAVRKMAGFSHFSYDFTRKSYFVQGLVFFGVIGAEAFPTHRRGRSQCLPGAHGGSVRNL